MKPYQDKNESDKIFSVYEKIYLPTKTAKIKFKTICFCFRVKNALLKIWKSVCEIFKPKFQIPTYNEKVGFDFMPDPKSERYLNNEDINQIRLQLIEKTEEKYNKNLFKHDVFARFVKPKHSTTEFLS